MNTVDDVNRALNDVIEDFDNLKEALYTLLDTTADSPVRELATSEETNVGKTFDSLLTDLVNNLCLFESNLFTADYRFKQIKAAPEKRALGFKSAQTDD